MSAFTPAQRLDLHTVGMVRYCVRELGAGISYEKDNATGFITSVTLRGVPGIPSEVPMEPGVFVEKVRAVRDQRLCDARNAMGLELLALMFPTLKITHGYIGNVYFNGRDDRAWYVFTDLRVDDGMMSFPCNGRAFDAAHVAIHFRNVIARMAARTQGGVL